MRRFLLLSFIVGCVAAILLWIAVDRMVMERLGKRPLSGVPAAYAAPYTLLDGQKVTLESVLSELNRRSYNQVEHLPEQAGQYALQERRIVVATRSFYDQSGSFIRETTFELDPESGQVLDRKNQSKRIFILEPEVVSAFGSKSIRSKTSKTLAQLPSSLTRGVVAIEDERFYQHIGIDFVGISRALVRNIQAGRIVEGGSTLTQQLAKNLFFSPKRALSRKIVEAFAAISLELRLSKEQILEMYLNEVYLGQEGSVALHGVASAAKSFFGKNIGDITLSESALLAGIIQAPSAYSPRFHLKRALKRRDVVLSKMREQNIINTAEYQRARTEKISVRKAFYHQRRAPYFAEALRRDLLSYIYLDALSLAGLQIHTGLSLPMQQCAEGAVTKGLAELEKNIPSLKRKGSPLQGALVALEPFSGFVKAWVGGRSYKENQFDHASQAKRQIGSTIKPFLYLSALDGELNSYKVATARSVLSDRPMKIETVNQDAWEPQNYDKTFHGDVTLRYALEKSLNLPAVYTAQKIGLTTLANTVKTFGINREALAVPSLALGAIETSLVDLTAAYSALANGGRYIQPRYFRTVINAEGDEITTSTIKERRVADEDAVYVLTNILQGVLQRGTARKVRALGFTRPAAGKTGTSDEARDAWFVGYTPTLTAGVWIGYDDNKKIGVSGGGAAAPIWAEFMKCADQHYKDYNFIKPTGVSIIEIDRTTGRRATSHCPKENIVQEVYVRETVPQSYCPKHSRIGREEIPNVESVPEPTKRRRRRETGFWDLVFGTNS